MNTIGVRREVASGMDMCKSTSISATAFFLVLLSAGCSADLRGFPGLYVNESWLEGLEEKSILSPGLARRFGIEYEPPWAPRDWYKVEILPDLILVDDGRLEIREFEASYGKLRFQTWTLRGVAEKDADDENRLSLTVTERLSGRQHRYLYLRMAPRQLKEAINDAEARADE